jgi:ABC-type antimicrobial peptide transport system permease subunit
MYARIPVNLSSGAVTRRGSAGLVTADYFRVLGQGMAPVATGLASGILAALGSVRLIARYLYGLPATDMTTFSTAVILLSAVAFLVCYVPARRAASSDLMKALRQE